MIIYSSKITGSLDISSSLTVGTTINAQSVTASLYGTSSWASNLAGSVVSASYSSTASYVTLAQTASYVETAQTASFVTTAQTASYVTTAQTASYVLNAVSASFATTATTAVNISQYTINQNLGTANQPTFGGVTSSLFGTASWANNVATASYVTIAQTASYVTTAQTASYVTTAQTASFVTTAQTASHVPNAFTTLGYNTSTGVLTLTEFDGGTQTQDLGIGSSDSPTFVNVTVAELTASFIKGNLTGSVSTASNASGILSAIATTGANRVMTDDGDGTLTAEANLSFNGSTLSVTSSLNVSSGITGSLQGNVFATHVTASVMSSSVNSINWNEEIRNELTINNTDGGRHRITGSTFYSGSYTSMLITQSAGQSAEFNLLKSNVHSFYRTGETAVTLSGASNGGRYLLFFQHTTANSTNYIVRWPTTVTWSLNTTHSFASGAGYTDIISITTSGSKYYAIGAGWFI